MRLLALFEKNKNTLAILGYILFLVSLSLEKYVNEARTICLLTSLPLVYFDKKMAYSLGNNRIFQILFLFPVIAFATTFCIGTYGNPLKTFDWIICFGVGFIQAFTFEKKSILLLVVLPIGCLLGSMVTVFWKFSIGESLSTLFTTGKLHMYNESPNRFGFCTALASVAVIGLLPLDKKHTPLWGVIALGSMFLCWYSQSRGAVFALFGTLCLAFPILFLQDRKKGLFLLGGGGFVACIGMFLVDDGRIAQTLENASWDFLLNGRGDIWQAAWEIFQKSPLAGFGIDSFHETLKIHLDLAENLDRFSDIRSQYVFWNAHQLILGILCEMGILGLLVFMVIAFRTFYGAIRTYPISFAPFLMLVLYLIAGAGGYGLHRSWNSAFLFLSMGLICGLEAQLGSAPRSKCKLPAEGNGTQNQNAAYPLNRG